MSSDLLSRYVPIQCPDIFRFIVRMSPIFTHMEKKQIPNPKSKLLTNSVVASVGMGLPPVINTPDNMAAIVLFVPIEERAPIVTGKQIGRAHV